MSAQWAGMESLQIGYSRILHDTTTSFRQPYNIVTNAHLRVARSQRRPSLNKRTAAGRFT
jgi:hypothetical protein